MASTATALEIPTGKVFNPHSQFCGSFIPNWLLRRPEIGHGAKLVYGRLTQYAGKDGECFPKLQTLADELAMGLSTVHKYVRELERWNLIRTIRRGLGMPNKYLFLTHIWMGSLRSGATIAEIPTEAVETTEAVESENGAGPVSPAAKPDYHESENLFSTGVETVPLEENQKKDNREKPEPKAEKPGIIDRLLLSFSKPKTQRVLDLIPEPHRHDCKPMVVKGIKSHGLDYVRHGIEYTLFRRPDSFGAYLRVVLRDGLGEQWAEQKRQAADLDAQRIEAAKAMQAAMEAENKSIEASNAEYEVQRQEVFNMPPDELSRLEADFIGGLSGFRLKRYRKKGLKAVESEFVEYCEQAKINHV